MNMLITGYIALSFAITLANAGLPKYRTSRIINGVEALPGELPYMTTFLVGGRHLCGGAIIANGWAITAAHCTYGQNLSNLAVTTDMTDFTNPGQYQWFDVAEVIQHPDFNQGSGAYPNDISLLRLYLDGRDISDLAVTIADGSNSFVGETCVMSGWGVTEIGSASNQLRRAYVTVLSQSECYQYWGQVNVLEQHICAMGMDTPDVAGACTYDNGGPLVCSEVLAGVISWGDSGCTESGTVELPTVSASLGYFYSWISSACNGCV